MLRTTLKYEKVTQKFYGKVWRCDVVAGDLLAGCVGGESQEPVQLADQPWPCLTGLALAHNSLRRVRLLSDPKYLRNLFCFRDFFRKVN